MKQPWAPRAVSDRNSQPISLLESLRNASAYNNSANITSTRTKARKLVAESGNRARDGFLYLHPQSHSHCIRLQKLQRGRNLLIIFTIHFEICITTYIIILEYYLCRIYNFRCLREVENNTHTEGTIFSKVPKNLVSYRSENNFVGSHIKIIL